MKRLIIPTIVALGFTCFSQAYAAVETYTVDEAGGYAIMGFVGNTPEDFALAQKQANSWELQRHLDLKPQSVKAVAIDGSKGVAMNDAQLRHAIEAAALAKSP
ncbi:hypothetical protein DVT68_13815 [Dyella solisilvae]|uniref:Uncharacterized protein n=1 Tax=Dyella solisilvae TaxID=1920168 RepID=A0A370K672_9GAMM|nr:hypothetical protein [Dyella solisilvae]RDI98151.1 hypothetical protein DVT68_13815 [Dyella solisilvae]